MASCHQRAQKSYPFGQHYFILFHGTVYLLCYWICAAMWHACLCLNTLALNNPLLLRGIARSGRPFKEGPDCKEILVTKCDISICPPNSRCTPSLKLDHSASEYFTIQTKRSACCGQVLFENITSLPSAFYLLYLSTIWNKLNETEIVSE